MFRNARLLWRTSSSSPLTERRHASFQVPQSTGSSRDQALTATTMKFWWRWCGRHVLSGLAAAIGDGRTTMPVDGARSSVDAMLPETVGDAVASLGTRIFIDENGDRALISFAQAEPAQVNPNDLDIARRSALSTAEDLAIGQIASFVGESVSLESEATSGQITQVYADLVQRGVEITTEQVQTIRSASGRVNVTGVQPVWRQVVQHPETEQDMALVAAVWSPSSQAMGERMSGAMDAARSEGSGCRCDRHPRRCAEHRRR